jgi:isopenicillin N synthase-like dioxygenase
MSSVGKKMFSRTGTEGNIEIENIWLPEADLQGFRAYTTAFYQECCQLQKKVLSALALGMPHVPANFFDDYHQNADNQLRLLHYLGGPSELFSSGAKGRVGAHTVSSLPLVQKKNPPYNGSGLWYVHITIPR